MTDDQWRCRAAGSSNLGNLYVSGVKDTGSYEDFLTMKYSRTGVRKWLKVWSGGEATGKGDITQGVLLKYQR